MNHLEAIKEFLDQHQDCYFVIDRNENEYVFRLRQKETSLEVNVNGSIFDNIDLNIRALLDAAKIPFE